MEKAFSSWRLYSCIRLICTSKMKCEGMSTPSFSSMYCAKARLFSPLMRTNASLNVWSCTYFSISLSSGKFVCQALPIRLSISFAISGLFCKNQRLGVIPFVTLMIFSGYFLSQLRKVFSFNIPVWICATPLTFSAT